LKALPGAAPPIIDHKLAANPYASLYGDDWEEKIANSTNVKKHVSIRFLLNLHFQA